MPRTFRPPPLRAIRRFVPHLGRLARAERWRRTKQRPRVWAHRGDSAHEPENTLAAFDKARFAGADGIELDVRLDGDGTVVVFHDEMLERLAGRPGRMAELPARERAALRVGGQPVPTLEEVLGEFGELECNVEIKGDRPARTGALVTATAEVIRHSGRADQILVSSFDPVALVQMHHQLPDIACAYLFHKDQPLPFRRGWVGNWTGASVLHPESVLCTPERVAAWHTAGFPVNAWTVDDAAELRRLDALGIDGVFCNDPAHAIAAFTAS
ncbi:MAG TPA: glycerophosphodiester phosphodiesterase [Kofleriaceae bacterium]|jgi:glycerophosphoryl diester phosphodiesterase